jgi:hypothetical protein
LEKKVNEDQSIISAMEVLEKRGSLQTERIDTMRVDHSCPTVQSVLTKINGEMGTFPSINLKLSVKGLLI